MLVTFSSDASGKITMFGDVAISLLRMAGHSGNVPGAILAPDLPAALAKLTTAIDKVKSESVDDNDTDEQQVSIAMRAVPLIDLLSAAAKDESDVTWE